MCGGPLQGLNEKSFPEASPRVRGDEHIERVDVLVRFELLLVAAFGEPLKVTNASHRG